MNMYFGIFKELKELNLPGGDMGLYEGCFAEFYDQLTAASTADLDNFLPYIDEKKGAVLELGCGTGRLLIKIAQKGHKVTGLDLSKSMLDILEKKLMNESNDVKGSICLYQEDMTNFKFNNQFGTCILGATSICLLPDDESILKMLQTVYNHLAPGARFIFDYSVCPDSPKKTIEVDPIRIFTQSNKSSKQFILIGEKKDYNNMVSTVNFYVETIDKSLNTVRNFGHTQKRLLTDKKVSSLIKLSPFEIIDSGVQKVKNYKIRYVVLEKKSKG